MKCSKCGKEKDETEFSFRNKALGKRHTICMECHRGYKRDYYRRNRESHYERNKKTLKKISDFLDDYKRTHACSVCGESAIECLDFHHINEKDLGLSTLRCYGSLDRVKSEIEKCIVLCSNCHRKVHAGTLKI